MQHFYNRDFRSHWNQVGYTSLGHWDAKHTHINPSCQSYSRVSGEVKLDLSVALPRCSMKQREITPPALHTQIVPVTTERREMLFLVCHQTKQRGKQPAHDIRCVTDSGSEYIHCMSMCMCCTSVCSNVWKMCLTRQDVVIHNATIQLCSTAGKVLAFTFLKVLDCLLIDFKDY